MFNQGLIKILDFGLNKQIDEEESRAALTSAGMGTHAYLPPEIHSYDPDDDRVLTSKVDIWSAGIIFYELLNGKKPTSIEDMLNYQNKLSGIQQQTIQIIELCLKLNPNERITPEEVYFH
jgi:serine/threonine protein kinase